MNDIEFIAILSGSSAIKIADDGSTRIQLEVPASELPKVIKMVAFTEKSFKVAIHEHDLR